MFSSLLLHLDVDLLYVLSQLYQGLYGPTVIDTVFYTIMNKIEYLLALRFEYFIQKGSNSKVWNIYCHAMLFYMT